MTKHEEIDMAQVEILRGAVEEIATNMKSGMNPKEIFDIDPNHLEGLYSKAYQLYNSGQYVEAAKIFHNLLMFNSMEVKYVFGMAACHHLLKEYESAIKLYALCSCLNPQDPLPYYHTSDCYMQQKDDKSALMSLKMCLKFAQDKNEFKDIYQRSLLTLSSLEKKFSPKK